jgi:hypothetical protein
LIGVRAVAMDRLVSGMAVLPAAGRRNRIELSAGTMPAPKATRGPTYQAGALIPLAKWRKPNAQEREILLADDCGQHDSERINVVKLPDALLAPFHKLREASERNRPMRELLLLASTPGCRAGVDAVIGHVKQRFQATAAADEELQGGLIVRPARLQTVTVHPQSRELVGLHLDNWFRLPRRRRHEAPNRICLNLGCQDRYFLFLNLSIRRMYDAVRRRVGGQLHPMMVGRHFMTLFPSYPVVRLRICPGEAYIAPTDNLIHDGSSCDMSVADLSLSLLGRFAPYPRRAGSGAGRRRADAPHAFLVPD